MSTASLRETIDDRLDADGSKIPYAWFMGAENLNQWAVMAFLSIINVTVALELFIALALFVLGVYTTSQKFLNSEICNVFFVCNSLLLTIWYKIQQKQ